MDYGETMEWESMEQGELKLSLSCVDLDFVFGASLYLFPFLINSLL